MSSFVTLEQLESPRAFGATATRLESFTSRVERTTVVPPWVAWGFNAALWFADLETFRESEDEALVSNAYVAKLDAHRVILSNLISRGERLLYAGKQLELPADFSLFSFADLRAAVASLETTLRCQHGGRNPLSVDLEIEKLFNVEKSDH
ncbi:MAG: hypothetical protein FJ403_09205 [Verrucomicrobia bacterium]|nr:hypothetical protein [Verrucomicrobiota bacterium]